MINENIKQINISDKDYPEILKEIHNPPKSLYVRGGFDEKDKIAIGIVGTRNYTSYGKQVAINIAGDLAEAGITVVSGLAKGIDAFAHQAALEKNGRTIAVLGSAVDSSSVYPSCNKKLAEKIAKSGAVISEYAPGTKSEIYFFPQRNRIVSGLSLGVVVIEAPEKSGALITATCALEQNREVFAVPGSIYSKNSVGTNKLIQMGAKLVNSANDILDELNLPLLKEKSKNFKPETKEEEILVSIITKEPIHLDEIVKQSRLNSALASSTLIMLELKGIAKHQGGGYYILNF
jgi:DNA processing protein